MRIKRRKKKVVRGKWKPHPVPNEIRAPYGIWEESYSKNLPKPGGLVVLINRNLNTRWGRMHHMMLARVDGKVIESQWATLQEAKNELFGDESEAIEIYPAESRKRDGANSYHLYVLADGQVPMGALAGEKFTE